MQGHILVRSALLTAGYLVGGMVAGVLLGRALDALPVPVPLRRTLATAVALTAVIFAGAGWGRAVGRLAGSPEEKRLARAGALSFGPTVVFTGWALAVLEGAIVQRGWGPQLPIHIVFTLLFVPAAFLVAAVGGLGLGLALRSRRLAGKVALGAGCAAAAAFLLVDLLMDSIGWRVGAPGAAQRATMLTVTTLGSLAAALAAGAVIGTVVSRQVTARSGETPPGEQGAP